MILRGTVQAGRIVVEGALSLNDGDEVMVVVRPPGVDGGAAASDSLWPAIVETMRLAERLGAELRAAAEPPARAAVVPTERRRPREIATVAATGRR